MCRKNKSARTAFARIGVAGLLGATLLLSGCGSPPKQQNARIQQAIQSNQQGEAAFYRGDYSRALIYFEEALRIDQAIENIGGVGANRLNLARTYIAMDDAAQARRHLDALLKNPLVTYPADQLAQAAALASTLYLAGGDVKAALELVEKGQAWCAGSCGALPSLLLLRAQIALRSGRPDEAIEHASNVLRRLDGNQKMEEKANALRVIGEALLDKKNPAESIARFEQALALDREAGVPQKISLDLMYLGQASNLVNKHADANAYFRRAAAVRTAAGDKSGAEIAVRNIEPKE
ncbi:MAG TPA: tetratricopeptide repeat protein [Burkholderiaceae bacterium]|jgi:tetratricopeptide (TPR) repeat protein